MKEIKLVTFKEGELIDNFMNRLNTFVAKLHELGGINVGHAHHQELYPYCATTLPPNHGVY
jgi:hypothetical protein